MRNRLITLIIDQTRHGQYDGVNRIVLSIVTSKMDLNWVRFMPGEIHTVRLFWDNLDLGLLIFRCYGK
jgi:hypothetical protein